MVLGGGIHQVDSISRQTLDRLAHEGLPATPRNYAVFFHHLSGDNTGLSAAFEKGLTQGKMSQTLCDELYDKYLVTDSEMSFFKDANSVIDTELKRVLGMLSVSAKETGQFGQNLDNFKGSLEIVNSAEALREAVSKIAEETRVVAEQNAKLQNELQTTTEQLAEMRSDFDRVHREAQIDPLTEVGNRKFFDREIVRTMDEAKAEHTQLSLLMVDIDHFKKFNDTHGHLIGDQVLRLVAKTLVENLKGRDVIARYGGEEFVIMLPQTRWQDAERVANQLRVSLASKQITRRGTNEVLGQVTISIGVAEFVYQEDADSLVARADAALYKAKQTGRNRVVATISS